MKKVYLFRFQKKHWIVQDINIDELKYRSYDGTIAIRIAHLATSDGVKIILN